MWCVGLFLVVGTALSGIICERVWSESELGISQIEGRGQGKGLQVPLCLTAGGAVCRHKEKQTWGEKKVCLMSKRKSALSFAECRHKEKQTWGTYRGKRAKEDQL